MNNMRFDMELKESGAYLHESEPKLILQASWYDYKTGQDHERVSVRVSQATEM